MSLPSFGVNNPVPVNLLMIGVIIGGLVSGAHLRREFFPETTPDRALVTLPYPGAIPEEVEEGLAIKVEDKLYEAIDEMDEMRTTIAEGGGGITVEFREGVNVNKTLDDVERAVDQLTDLPDESEKITTQLFEPRLPVILVSLFGDMPEPVMKDAIRAVRDDLRTLPGMGELLVEGVRDYEIRVDVHQQALLQYGISLPQVAAAINDAMIEIPGGTVRSRTGNIKFRTMGTEERAKAIGRIIVRAEPDGRTLRVQDIATVRESFTDDQLITRFNGKPCANIVVFKVGDQDIVTMAEMVRAYVQGRRGEKFKRELADYFVTTPRHTAWNLGNTSQRPLPAGARIVANNDLARFVEGRLDLLLRNAGYGAVLVFLTLLIFLNWRVAFWVGMGLITAICGTLILMTAFDVTLNLLTMFGLIIVLGLLVDDAIVVSEHIQKLHDDGQPAMQTAVAGAKHVLWPVVATVLTTVVAFLPLTFVRGQIGDLLGALPMVVACALTMSLIEALLILPCHMAHSLSRRDHSHPGRFVNVFRRYEVWRDKIIFARIVPGYARLLNLVIEYRYISCAVAIGTLIVSLGMVQGKQVGFTFLPRSDAETFIVDLRMPIGTPIEQTNQAVQVVEQTVMQVAGDVTKSISATIGQQSNIDTGQAEAAAPHVAQMFVELVFVEQRDRPSAEIINDIRQALVGKLDGVERMTFSEISGGPGGADITLQILGDNVDLIEQAANEIKTTLGQFDGLYDIADDNDAGQIELRININPSGNALGFTTANLAPQIRGALYGIDAHVFAARQEDIDVRVRLDERTRRNLYAMENLWVVSPVGRIVPLSQVATISDSSTYATIKRINRRRAVTITAYTAPGLSPEDVVEGLTDEASQASVMLASGGGKQKPIDVIRAKYPQLQIKFAGRQEQLGDAFGSLPYGFLAAVIMIYVILAWLFSRYFQPILVMLVIPFSLIGVIWGHWLLGYDLTFLSMIGTVALAGIVVNDSLILIEFYNGARDAGKSVHDALIDAGRARLRPIILTTLTTVLGLTPLILEQSFQAKFLIPMAIAIAMGLLSATVLVLLVLPCFMVVFDDIRQGGYFLWFGRTRPNDVLTGPAVHHPGS